jgi:hypothetical protein
MSAYGHIKAPSRSGSLLRTRIWSTKRAYYLYTFHLTLAEATRFDGLVEYLHSVFSDVVEEGMTYPQEGDMNRSTFEGYFFAADVIVAITGPSTLDAIQEGTEVDTELDAVRGGRSWEECVGGFYYVS